MTGLNPLDNWDAAAWREQVGDDLLGGYGTLMPKPTQHIVSDEPEPEDS